MLVERTVLRTVMIEVSTAEEARRIILADLDVDLGSYNDELEPVESGIGDITVAVDRYEPEYRSPQVANF